MRNLHFSMAAAALAGLVLAGCDRDPGQGAAGVPRASEYRVLDSFQVGDPVFVRSLAVEAERKTLWVGTSGGVHEVDLETQALRGTFTRDHGLANEYVFGIGIDSQGYKWFGTNAGGVSRYKDGQWKTYFPMHGLADYWVYSFANDKAGDLWIGTWAGVNHFDLKTQKLTTYVKELVNEWVYGISVDAQGRVWFGTEGGVSVYDGKEWKSWTHADGIGAVNKDRLPHSTNTGLGTRSRHDLGILAGGDATYNPGYVFAIHAAPDGTIWAGTWGGGVSRFDGKAWTNLTVEHGLPSNVVYSIAQDAAGALWFGTGAGVARYDGRQWSTVGAAEGLPVRDVYAVAAAPDGTVWAGLRGMVARLGKAAR